MLLVESSFHPRMRISSTRSGISCCSSKTTKCLSLTGQKCHWCLVNVHGIPKATIKMAAAAKRASDRLDCEIVSPAAGSALRRRPGRQTGRRVGGGTGSRRSRSGYRPAAAVPGRSQGHQVTVSLGADSGRHATQSWRSVAFACAQLRTVGSRPLPIGPARRITPTIRGWRRFQLAWTADTGHPVRCFASLIIEICGSSRRGP